MWQAFYECCIGGSASSETHSIAKSKSPAPVRSSANGAANGRDQNNAGSAQTGSSNTSVLNAKRGAAKNEEEESSSDPFAFGPSAGFPSTAGKQERPKMPNYLFYSNKLASSPNPSGTVTRIHSTWFGDYSLLEYHHGYIQWLFPVFESGGMSFHSSRLEKEEAKLMRQDLQCSIRFIKSYKLILDFYGMVLLDYETGQLGRNKSKYKSRYRNLNWNGHNFLRISRILMSLGELGFVRYKIPLVEFFEKEIESTGRLDHCKYSLKEFWKPLCDPSLPGYKKKTREEAEDREESVFFTVLAAGGDEWKAAKRTLDDYPIPQPHDDDDEPAKEDPKAEEKETVAEPTPVDAQDDVEEISPPRTKTHKKTRSKEGKSSSSPQEEAHGDAGSNTDEAAHPVATKPKKPRQNGKKKRRSNDENAAEQLSGSPDSDEHAALKQDTESEFLVVTPQATSSTEPSPGPREDFTPKKKKKSKYDAEATVQAQTSEEKESSGKEVDGTKPESEPRHHEHKIPIQDEASDLSAPNSSASPVIDVVKQESAESPSTTENGTSDAQ